MDFQREYDFIMDGLESGIVDENTENSMTNAAQEDFNEDMRLFAKGEAIRSQLLGRPMEGRAEQHKQDMHGHIRRIMKNPDIGEKCEGIYKGLMQYEIPTPTPTTRIYYLKGEGNICIVRILVHVLHITDPNKLP